MTNALCQVLDDEVGIHDDAEADEGTDCRLQGCEPVQKISQRSDLSRVETR